MSTGGSQNVGGAGGQAQLQIDHVRVSKTRTRLTARLGGDWVHQDEINVNSATARGRFAEKVAAKTEFDQQEIEEQLLGIVAELAELYGDDDSQGVGPQPFHLVHDNEDPEQRGLYCGPMQLINATLEVIEDVRVVDDVESGREFKFRATLGETTSEFTISAEDFASNNRLPEAIYAAVGPKVRILCKPHVLRTAVSAVSAPISRTSTTNFGWTKDGDAYLTPSVRIDASGIHPLDPTDPHRVDLEGEPGARHLDMVALSPEQLAEVKAHAVTDLLRLNVRRVTFLMLAATALAVLIRFVEAMNRPAVWLIGRTGDGKSFLARLFMNFFGDFPIALGDRLGSWTSTAYYIQRQGYFHRDAIYVIDDYKPDVVKHADVIKILQNYADGSARGRLKSDATANVVRPIRGILTSTAEDLPEHSASSVARTVVGRVPPLEKDIERGLRCLAQRGRYRGLMAAFIRHLIANCRTAQFAARVEVKYKYYYADIAGENNDIRIAGNFALLAAAFEEFAAFLADAWPGWEQEAEAFINQDLKDIRDEMLAEVRGQQAGAVFLTTLRALVTNGHVQVKGWQPGQVTSEKDFDRPTIGRKVVINPEQGSAFDIVTSLALGAVQDSLRKQGKPPLAATEKALVRQMAGDGKLLGKDFQPIPPESGGDHTWAVKLEGASRNAFRIWASELTGETTITSQTPNGATGNDPGDQSEGEAS